MTPMAMTLGVATAIKATVAKQVDAASNVVDVVNQGSGIRFQAHSKTIKLLIQKAQPAHVSPLVSPQFTKPLLVCVGFFCFLSAGRARAHLPMMKRPRSFAFRLKMMHVMSCRTAPFLKMAPMLTSRLCFLLPLGGKRRSTSANWVPCEGEVVHLTRMSCSFVCCVDMLQCKTKQFWCISSYKD